MTHDSVLRLAQVCCGVSAIAVPVLLDANAAQAEPTTPEAQPPLAPIPAVPAPVTDVATEEPIPAVSPVAEPAKPAFAKTVPPTPQPTVAQVTPVNNPQPEIATAPEPLSESITAPPTVSAVVPEPVFEAAAPAVPEPVVATQSNPDNSTVEPLATEYPDADHADIDHSDTGAASSQLPGDALQETEGQTDELENTAQTAAVDSTASDITAPPPAVPEPSSSQASSISTELSVNSPTTTQLTASAPESETPTAVLPPAPALDANGGTETLETSLPTSRPVGVGPTRETLPVLAAAPELSAPPSGSAVDLSNGTPIRLSRAQQTSPRPRYDLEMSAAQLAASNSPRNSENAADLDGLLDRAGLQFEGLRTDTEIAQLDLDYGSATGEPSGQAKTTRYMANAYYDLPLGGPIRPYIGAGVGYTNIAMRPDNPAVERTTETRFAYQLRTGLRCDIAPQVTLNLGYRYFAIPGQVQMGDGQRAVSSSAVEFGLQARF